MSLAITGNKRSVDKISSIAPFLFAPAAENIRRWDCGHEELTFTSSTAAFNFSLFKGKPDAQMTQTLLYETTWQLREQLASIFSARSKLAAVGKSTQLPGILICFL